MFYYISSLPTRKYWTYYQNRHNIRKAEFKFLYGNYGVSFVSIKGKNSSFFSLDFPINFQKKSLCIPSSKTCLLLFSSFEFTFRFRKFSDIEGNLSYKNVLDNVVKNSKFIFPFFSVLKEGMTNVTLKMTSVSAMSLKWHRLYSEKFFDVTENLLLLFLKQNRPPSK